MGGRTRSGGRAGNDGVSGATLGGEGAGTAEALLEEVLVGGVSWGVPEPAEIASLTEDVEDEEEPIEDEVVVYPPGCVCGGLL